MANATTPSVKNITKDLQSLISTGFDINKPPPQGNVPLLHKSISKNERSIFNSAIEVGADVNAVDNDVDKQTPLHYAAIHHYRFIKPLIEKGANVNALNKFGQTPLAVILERPPSEPLLDAVKLLVTKDTINLQDTYSLTPLHYAVSNGFRRVTRLLVQLGANIYAKTNDDDGNMTPIFIAFNNKQYDLVKILTETKPVSDVCKLGVLPTIFDESPLDDFVDEQEEFIKTLSQREINILKLYTFAGDRVINQVLRGNLQDVKLDPNKPFFKALKFFTGNSYDPDFQNSFNIFMSKQNGGEVAASIKDTVAALDASNLGIIRKFVTEFLEVFKKIPILKQELVVYRSVEREVDIFEHGNEFLSTTIDPEVARRFFNEQNGCCFIQIKLNPGVRALWIAPISKFPQENEILIGPPFNAKKEVVSPHEFILTVSPKVKAGKRRKTYRKNSKKYKGTKRNPISYRSFFG